MVYEEDQEIRTEKGVAFCWNKENPPAFQGASLKATAQEGAFQEFRRHDLHLAGDSGGSWCDVGSHLGVSSNGPQTIPQNIEQLPFGFPDQAEGTLKTQALVDAPGSNSCFVFRSRCVFRPKLYFYSWGSRSWEHNRGMETWILDTTGSLGTSC